MNIQDINALQERINGIAVEGASPDIIIAPKLKIPLREYASRFQANRCTMLTLYNEFRGRSVTFPIRSEAVPVTSSTTISNIPTVQNEMTGTTASEARAIPITIRTSILGLAHIIAAMANTKVELNNLIQIGKQINSERLNAESNLISTSLPISGSNDIYPPEMEQLTRSIYDAISSPSVQAQTGTNIENISIPSSTIISHEGATSDIRPVRRDIEVAGLSSQPVHKYVASRSPRPIEINLRSIYSNLKGMINITGKILSIQAITGGIAMAYPGFPIENIYKIISRLEYESSPLHVSPARFTDNVAWYKEQMGLTPTPAPSIYGAPAPSVENLVPRINPTTISFYGDSLIKLSKIPVVKLQMYEPQVELERMIIRPTEPLDMIDMVSQARTSPDVPIIVANTENGKIIKTYNKIETLRKIELSWFMEAKKSTTQDNKNAHMMNIIVRISKFPDKYQMVQYNGLKNVFTINRTEKYLSTSEIITLLCTHLHIDTLTVPQISNTTYSFVTNYIEGVAPTSTGRGGRGDTSKSEALFGLDQHIIAWLITNPPPAYRDANLHKFIFVKEDTKPNALRDHISIHIQLGTEKLYLTLSKHDTTGGTLVPVPRERIEEFRQKEEYIESASSSVLSRDLIGFFKGQKYLQVRINKAQSIYHARIAQSIYQHIISMYLNYYLETRNKIFTITNISLPVLNPRIVELQERIPDLREKYAFVDPILFKYVSDIKPLTLLPVPIERDEADYWIKRLHTVIRLPTVVVNNPLIRFETSGEVWLRTYAPGRFILTEKKEGGYIPVMFSTKSGNGILVEVNTNDWTLTDTQIRPKGDTYVLKDYKSLSDPKFIGRLAYISKAALELLNPIIPNKKDIANLYRIGISMNIRYALNSALSVSIKPEDIAKYAYLCMQECWEQSAIQVEEDIRMQRTHPMKHFRALEKAYGVNIYFLMDDSFLAPELRKPPHALFYLHRKANKNWPSIIFHSLSSEPDTFSLITIKAEGGRGGRYIYLFQGQEYLDNVMNKNNIIRMVSPVDNINSRLETVPIQDSFTTNAGIWKATEQIVDAYGKCRAITYSRNVTPITTIAPRQTITSTSLNIPTLGNTSIQPQEILYVTINIGFAPIQDLPLGDIRDPSIGLNSQVPAIIQDMQAPPRVVVRERYLTYASSSQMNPTPQVQSAEFIKALEALILQPVPSSELTKWAEMEKNMRVLRIVAHLLYSHMPIDLSEFMLYIKVKEDVKYNVSGLKHALPNTHGSYMEAWRYFARILPGMVSTPESINITTTTVPNPNTLQSNLEEEEEDVVSDVEEESESEETSYSIYVPDEATKRALYLHMLATPKIKWPMRFPSYVRYSWDIKAGRDESVFLKEIDLIQYMITVRAPSEAVSIIISPVPYILSRGDHKYLVQMVRSTSHAEYIAYKWETNFFNPGYEDVGVDVEYPLNMVSPDFTDRLYEISTTIKDNKIFVIIPI